MNPRQRNDSWAQLGTGTFDVLIVGGGVTGTGAALDATTRGLRTAVVEQRDWAAGTSSRSSKLFHGGLRYLEQLNFSLVREALRERELMLSTLAPHLVRPVSFLYPLRHRGWERPYIGAGMLLYDHLGGARSVPGHRHYTRRGALTLAPGLDPAALTGALRYHDAQVDDARHTLTLVRTAAAHGAVARSSTEVVALHRDGKRVTGARVRDVETGAVTDVRARVVVNCAGVWSDRVHELAGGDSPFTVRASKGVHITVPREVFRSESGLILRAGKSVLFFIPWGARWVIGTTDTPWDLDAAHPAATSADIAHILHHANSVLTRPLTTDDILGVYAGLRPLLAQRSGGDTTALSREHAVARSQPGLVSVAGGKYTTYRVMAADAIDTAAPDLPGLRPSVTAMIPILGADGYHALVNRAGRLATDYGLEERLVRALLDRYGSLTGEVLAPAAGKPGLLAPVPGAEKHLKAEIRYAATHEGALHIDDVLARRTRVSIECGDRGTEAAEAVAGLMGDVLGWDARTRDAEVEAYSERVSAERAAHQLPDDVAAATARLRARDSRSVS
ncbi:glycerol-3-phosphate dehydrogenase/oxidase [Amycolatopsis acidiphila]|uniref:Glycerol-3-phosphate dehydrogenase n=1 Tax=Amycolatopsis acidiphila TaxID=715473 RepID=A0A558ALI3_9PSEU|nr:glycerol-3-phosphate dehydrogenase/oxidase [Amycolatopsis acidiphila]